MKLKLLAVSMLCVLLNGVVLAEERYSVHGKVIDGDADKPLIGANVTIVELQRGSATNRRGEFIIDNITEGSYTLRVDFIGYAAYEQLIVIPDGVKEDIIVELYSTPIKIDDIIITATPTGSPLVYQAAQSYTLEELQKRTASSFGEMLNHEPGVAMRSFGSAPARPVIRGFDGDRILILENGERTGDISEAAFDNVIALEPLSANRVEVVRGPASLLYGTSALGGVVNIFTEDVPAIWSRGLSGSLALTAASMNRTGAGFGRLTYGGSSWAATGRFSHRDAGNIRTPDGVLPDTFIRSTTGSIGTAFQGGSFNGGLSLGLLDMTHGIPEKIDAPDESVEIQLNRYNMQGNANWSGNGFFNDIELRFNSSRFEHKEVELEAEPDGTIDEDIELDILRYNVSSTLTLRHQSAGIIERGALGIYGNFRDMTVGGDEALTPDSRSTFLAAFLFEEIHVSDLVHLKLGSRVEVQDLDIRGNEMFPAINDRRTTTTFSGAAGVNFRFSGAIEAGTQFARSHRAPLVEELYSDGPHLATGMFEVGDPGLENEIGHGFDVFVRYQSTRIRAEIAGFYNNISDYILLQPTGDIDRDSGLPVFVYEAHDATLQGGEFSFEALFTSSLRVRSTLDYVRGSRSTEDESGIPLPFIPPFRSSLELQYGTNDWWTGVSTRYVTAQNRVAPGEDPTKGYFLVGLEAGYRFDRAGRHTLSVRIDNIFDNEYRDHLSRVEDRDFPMPGRDLNIMYRRTF